MQETPEKVLTSIELANSFIANPTAETDNLFLVENIDRALKLS